MNARSFGNLVNVDRPLAEALAHGRNHTAEVRAKFHRLSFDNGDPFTAMRLEQFRQQTLKSSAFLLKAKIARQRLRH